MGETYWTGEQHLIRTAPRWTILRVNYYAESILDEIRMSLGMGVLAGLGDERVAYVSRRDVAAATAGALLSDGHAGAIYNLTGTQTLSGEERAALVSQITGTPVAFASVSPEQLRHQLAQAGLPPFVVDAIIEIKLNFTTGAFDVVTQDVARLSGQAPRSLRELIAAALT